MSDYDYDQFRIGLRSEVILAGTKMYVLIGDTHFEVIGFHHKLNGGAIIFELDENSVHYIRDRLGSYTNVVHERRTAASK